MEKFLGWVPGLSLRGSLLEKFGAEFGSPLRGALLERLGLGKIPGLGPGSFS